MYLTALNKPRSFWLMVTVLQILKGMDNKVISVKIKQSNGAKEFHLISKLYPLELTISHSVRIRQLMKGHHAMTLSLPVDAVMSSQCLAPEKKLQKGSTKCLENFYVICIYSNISLSHSPIKMRTSRTGLSGRGTQRP